MDLSDLLIESKTASDFLKGTEARLKSSEGGFSYAEFARKAGFSARSYVREVFQGKKGLTAKALPSFSRALGLRREEREILRCLLCIENPDFDSSTSKEVAAHALNLRRNGLKRRKITEPLPSLEKSRTQKAQPIELWPKVYAALGGDTSLPAIIAKTRLSPPAARRALSAMLEAGIIREEDGAYFPTDRHLVLDPAIHTEMIRAQFSSVIGSALTSAQENFKDPNRLYFVSSFGVKKGRVPELKKKLIETLLRFVDETEDGENEEVVSLAVTLI